MPSSPWLLRVVAAGDGPRWDVVQPRTGLVLDAAPTQDLAVERALVRLSTGGAVEVVVDGFVVRRQVVLPPPVPRRTTAVDLTVFVGVAGLMAVLLGPVLHSSAMITVLGSVNVANAVRLVRRSVLLRRTDRPHPGSSGPPTDAHPADRASHR